MAIDCIIAEVRQAREELAQRFHYDLQAMIRDARERQAAGGRRVVSLPPRPVRRTTGTPSPNQRRQPTGVAEEGGEPRARP